MLKNIFIRLKILSNFTNASSSLNCIWMKNQKSKTKHQIVNVNSNNPIFYPFSIKISKWCDNCNNIINPYAKICVPDIMKNLNVKLFNLMSRTNENRFIEWHEKCKYKRRLDAIVSNNKQPWVKNKFWCQCKELFDKGVCDKEFIWNPSNCECECEKSCNIGEYLDYENCKCRTKLVHKLIDEYTKTIEEVKLAIITLENENSYYNCSSFKVYIVFRIAAFTIFTKISIYFVYYISSLIKNNVSSVKFNTRKETKIWWMQFYWMNI